MDYLELRVDGWVPVQFTVDGSVLIHAHSNQSISASFTIFSSGQFHLVSILNGFRRELVAVVMWASKLDKQVRVIWLEGDIDLVNISIYGKGGGSGRSGLKCGQLKALHRSDQLQHERTDLHDGAHYWISDQVNS